MTDENQGLIEKPKKPRRRFFALKLILGIVVSLFVLFVIVGIIAINSPTTPTIQAQTPTALSPAPAPSADAAIIGPREEVNFINIVLQSRDRYSAGSNDMAKGATRPARGTSICRAVPHLTISNWVGKIATLSSNSDGNGVLAITLADNVTVTTWNNSLSDFEDHTLILPSDPLLAQVSSMKVGDIVRFSGHFFHSDVDCFNEQSVSIEGSMTDPDFTLRFSSVSPYSS